MRLYNSKRRVSYRSTLSSPSRSSALGATKRILPWTLSQSRRHCEILRRSHSIFCWLVEILFSKLIKSTNIVLILFYFRKTVLSGREFGQNGVLSFRRSFTTTFHIRVRCKTTETYFGTKFGSRVNAKAIRGYRLSSNFIPTFIQQKLVGF